MPWSTLTPLISYRRHASAEQRVVHLAGELDLSSIEPVSRLLDKELTEAEWLTLDLSRMSFIDALGISVLLGLRQRADRSGRRFTVRRPHPMVRHVSRLLALTRTLSIEAGGSTAPPPDVVAVLDEALDGAMRIAGAQYGNAQFADPTGALRLVAHRGFGRAFLDFFETVDGDDSACAAAYLDGRPEWVHDVATSAIFDGAPARQVVLDAGVNAVVSLPVMVGGRAMGVISVHHDRQKVWSPAQRQRLTDHVRLAGAVLAGQLTAG